MASLTSYTEKLGKKHAAHLLRRLTFGSNRTDIDAFAQMTAQQACQKLLEQQSEREAPFDASGKQAWLQLPANDESLDHGQLKKNVLAWWLDEMVNGDLSATPKLTFFLHTHFTTIVSRLSFGHALYYQLKLFRFYALGSLKDLAKNICLDNAMLQHLDGALNEKGRPNENYAREFLELYTIGKGPQKGPGDYTNYTEEDVVAAAKVFSGYKLDKTFANMPEVHGCALARLEVNSQGLAIQHDASVKQFSQAFNKQTIAPSETVNGFATEAAALDEINQLVDMVFEQKETARHFCRKIYRFFVYYRITEEVEQDIINPLADILIQNNYTLAPVLTALFTSQHFYDADNSMSEDNVVGAIIKSPLDIVVGSLRFFGVFLPSTTQPVVYAETYQKGILKFLELQGLALYEPFEVAGYPAYHQFPAYHRNWITANYLARRYEYSKLLLEGVKGEGDSMLYQLDMVAYVSNPAMISDPMNPRLMVEELLGYMLPEIITEERFTYFLKVILLDNLSAKNWQIEWQNYLKTGDDAAVKIQLENLVKTIMQSPEYQLF